ncbi:MAG: polysaccharide biosynthesis protein [Bacteroidales bacterium]|nr:polysaccharide biosynthesis protein [Bacteroidales bacterium]
MLQDSDNKRVAKNSIMLYLRMLVTMVVGFYTSRVVLQVLGEEDFGVYGLVGGIVGMLSFLNTTMSGATSRFLTFELGKGNKSSLSSMFDSALIVHIWIAVIVFIVAETAGLWFVNHKLVIPAERMIAANWVYQCAIVSVVVSIIQVPYVASIVAHEKMGVYAYIDIINVSMKLAIVFLLVHSPWDKLIFYSVLMMTVTLLTGFIYRRYAVRHFEECRYTHANSREKSKDIMSFFGFNMFGNFGLFFNMQVVNILINNFFGLVYNAASGIAVTVSNVVSSFANNTIMAFRPPITKSYAAKELDKAEDFTILGMQMSLFFFALFAIPVIVEVKTLMRLWLEKVPDQSDVFCRLLIMSILFETIRRVCVISIHATGKVKAASLFLGILLTINPLIVYLLFKAVHIVSMAYVSNVFINIVLSLIMMCLVKRQIPEYSLKRLVFCVAKMLLVIGGTMTIVYLSVRSLPATLLRMLLSALLSTILLSAGTYFLCLEKNKREWAMSFIRRKFKRN